MVCSYLLHGCDVIRIFKPCIEDPDSRRRRKPGSFVQFENENDVTSGVINMNIPRFPVFQVFWNIT